MSDEAYRAGHGNWPKDNYQPVSSIEHDRYNAGRRQREQEEQHARDRVARDQQERQRAETEQRNRINAQRESSERQLRDQQQRAWQQPSNPTMPARTYGGGGSFAPSRTFAPSASGSRSSTSYDSGGGFFAWIWRTFVKLVKAVVAIIVLLVVVAVIGASQRKKSSVSAVASSNDVLPASSPLASRPQPRIAPSRLPAAAGYAMTTATVTLRHRCAEGQPIYVRFFDESHGGATWPANNRMIVVQPGADTTVDLPCSPGARICTGASNTLRADVGLGWGSGLFRQFQPPPAYCFTCSAGPVAPPAFACRPGN